MTTTKIPVEFLNALSGSEITDGSIGTADIADSAITTAKIAANAITATQLPDNVITATHIPNGLITGTHMAGTTITATQIANNAVGTDQLAGIARGKIIYGDSNGDPQLLTIGSNGTALVSDGTDISWGSAGETNRLPLAGGTMTGDLTIAKSSAGADSTFKVASTAASGDNDATVIINNGGTGDAMLRFDYESDTDRARIGVITSAQALQFFTAGNNEKMRIASDGAVTLKPNGITTGLRLQGRSSDNHFYVQWKSNDGSANYGAIGSLNSGGLQYQTNTHIFQNEASNAEYMRIDSSGNVGIGTNAPSSYLATELVVATADEGGITLANSSTNHKSNIYFADGTSGNARNRGNVSYDHGTDALSFGTAAGHSRLVIDNAGAATFGGLLTANGINLGKAFGTSSIMIGDSTTGTINAANHNTGVGVDIFAALTSGDGNTVMGFSAGTTLNTGQRNVAIGFQSLDAGNSASDSVMIGYEAGGATVDGIENTCIGYYAGHGDMANYNTFVGSSAGQNSTGQGNTFLGSRSGDANASASNNVAVGYESLGSNQTGTGLVAVGTYALAVSTGSYTTAVGMYAGGTTGGNESTYVGYQAGRYQTGADNVAIGSGAGAGTQSASGVANVYIGQDAGRNHREAANNVAIGKGALSTSTSASHCIAIGHSALSLNTRDSNIAIGYLAGRDLSGTADRNLFIGADAGKLINGVSDNIAIGYGAMVRATSGQNGNIAIGNNAGRAVTSSNSCSQLVAIGHEVASHASAALAGHNNIFVGYNIASGSALTSAFQNTAVGSAALRDLRTGDHNVAMGYQAGQAVQGGGENVFIGSGAGIKVDSGSQNVAIGRESFVDATSQGECVAVGFQALENCEGNANVGIGYKAGETISSGTSNVCIGHEVDAAHDSVSAIAIGKGITGQGDQVKMGKPSNVISNVFTGANAWTYASDERIKQDIEDNTLGLSFINNLRTTTYRWKPSNKIPKEFDDYSEENLKDTEVVMHGLIAQNVKSALDEENVDTFAGWSEEQDGMQNISREMFVIPLIKALQEADAKIDALTARIEELEE